MGNPVALYPICDSCTVLINPTMREIIALWFGELRSEPTLSERGDSIELLESPSLRGPALPVNVEKVFYTLGYKCAASQQQLTERFHSRKLNDI